MDCVFCRIVKGDLPSFKVYEDEHTLVFMDIAKDIAKEEKKVIFSYLGWTDTDGNLYDMSKCISHTIISLFAIETIYCLITKDWSLKSLLIGLRGVLSIILIELIVLILSPNSSFNVPALFILSTYNSLFFCVIFKTSFKLLFLS